MAKQWINAANVLLDDEGRLAIVLPAELIEDGKLKVQAEASPPEGAATEAKQDAIIAAVAGLGPASAIVCGTLAVADAGTPEPLVEEPTPCKRVWIGAPCDALGAAENTRPAFIGGEAAQTIPLVPSNYEGFVIDIDDAAKLFVKVGVDGQSVRYAILA